MSSNNGRGGATSAYFRKLMQEIFNPTPEQLEARARDCRRSIVTSNAAADFPDYPTKKGLHLLRRALPEVPLRIHEERAQKGGGK